MPRRRTPPHVMAQHKAVSAFLKRLRPEHRHRLRGEHLAPLFPNIALPRLRIILRNWQ